MGEWLAEVALGWTTAPLGTDPRDGEDASTDSDSDDGDQQKGWEQDPWVGHGALGLEARGAGVGAGRGEGNTGNGRGREGMCVLLPQARAGAVLLSALAWSCPKLARRVLAACVERAAGGGAAGGEPEEGAHVAFAGDDADAGERAYLRNLCVLGISECP